MEFSYDAYKELLITLKDEGYDFETFNDKLESSKSVICRHDVDMSLEHVVPMAELEHSLDVSSIYFVLLSTNFYNVFSPENREVLRYLKKIGHKIGLHFDASIYEYDSISELEQYITKEQKILQFLLEDEIEVVSFHRPVKELFNVSLQNGMVSAYEEKYFSNYEYVSDSRRNWRKDPYSIIQRNVNHVQLLTHPIWYSDKEVSANESIHNLKNNINNLIEISLENNINEYEALMKGRE